MVQKTKVTNLRESAERHIEARGGQRLKISDLQADPSQLISPANLCELNLVRSYPTLHRKMKSENFPDPIAGPNNTRLLHWVAGAILDHFGIPQTPVSNASL